MKQLAPPPYAACSAARIAWPGGSMPPAGIEYTTVAPARPAHAATNDFGVDTSTGLTCATSTVAAWSVVAAAAIIVALAVGWSVTHTTRRDAYGSGFLVVRSRGGGSSSLTWDDVRAIETRIPSIELAAPYLHRSTELTTGDRNW